MKLLFTTLLLPPGLFIFPAIVAAFLLCKKKKAATLFLTLAIVLGWAFSTVFMGKVMGAFLISQVRAYEPEDPKKTDMIVVLASGITYVGEPFGWLPTAESFRRTQVAYNLQSLLGSRIPVVIAGGKTEGLRYPSEAETIKKQFDRSSAQLRLTLVENSSRNTYESAIQVAAIARDRQADDIILVTSDVHMLRSLAVFRGRGMNPAVVPAVSLRRGKTRVHDILPSWQGVELNAKVLYEILGLAQYLMTGKVTWSDIFYTPLEK